MRKYVQGQRITAKRRNTGTKLKENKENEAKMCATNNRQKTYSVATLVQLWE
jgi:hypothetical protein